MNERLRTLPKVDDVLACLNEPIPRAVLVDCIREVLDDCRKQILQTAPMCSARNAVDFTSATDIAARAITLAKTRLTPTLRPVINATGVVLHTNLGRAPLPEAVAEHVKQIAMGYSTLEYNLQTGKRGSRTAGIENLLTNLTGAEAACIVNNNAAAVLLTLAALCKSGEVIVSRGELVEIGGSFRVPDVISQGGAILREVGTTNKTHLRDYENAICENTAAILKVHTSNYKVMGFTKEVEVDELAALAKETDLISIYDLGSGSFISFAGEPIVQEALKSGVDMLCFSGDKLLGGPQCGIVLGKKEQITKLQKHPLYRALRADKLSLAALEATLLLYLDIENAKVQIPALTMLAEAKDLKQKATLLLEQLDKNFNAYLQQTNSQAGGGSLPLQEFESWAVAIPSRHLVLEEKEASEAEWETSAALTAPTANVSHPVAESHRFTIPELEQHLRNWQTPIIARIHKDTLLLDVRTIDEQNLKEIVQCLQAKIGGS